MNNPQDTTPRIKTPTPLDPQTAEAVIGSIVYCVQSTEHGNAQPVNIYLEENDGVMPSLPIKIQAGASEETVRHMLWDKLVL